MIRGVKYKSRNTTTHGCRRCQMIIAIVIGAASGCFLGFALRCLQSLLCCLGGNFMFVFQHCTPFLSKNAAYATGVGFKPVLGLPQFLSKRFYMPQFPPSLFSVSLWRVGNVSFFHTLNEGFQNIWV